MKSALPALMGTALTLGTWYREGRIPGRRLHGRIRPVRFLWSEVEAAWDGNAQLSIEDRVA
jgi:hypothetical protein